MVLVPYKDDVIGRNRHNVVHPPMPFIPKLEESSAAQVKSRNVRSWHANVLEPGIEHLDERGANPKVSIRGRRARSAG